MYGQAGKAADGVTATVDIPRQTEWSTSPYSGAFAILQSREGRSMAQIRPNIRHAPPHARANQRVGR